MSKFHPLEVVICGSDTQLHVGENFKFFILGFSGLISLTRLLQPKEVVGATQCGLQKECVVPGSAPISRILECEDLNAVCDNDHCVCRLGFEMDFDTGECTGMYLMNLFSRI